MLTIGLITFYMSYFCLVQGINGTKLYAEHTFTPNFTVTDKIFCLSLHYHGDNSYLFVNNREIVKFKEADSEIVPYILCSGNISKDFNSINAQKTGLYGYVCDFSVDYRAITSDKTHEIHAYLMKKKTKNNIV